MAYVVAEFNEILQSILDDYRNRVPGADVSADTEIYIRSAVTAGAVWGLYHGLKYVENQAFPSTADSENLRRHAATWDIEPKEAVTADDGLVELSGVDGTVVAAGLALSHADGTTYTSSSGGVVAGGVLSVSAVCDLPGLVGNRSVGQELTVQSPPAGVESEASVISAFIGGAEAETDAALLERLLARIRQGNAGGTAADWEAWALSIDGVAFAYCLPLRRGAGTVDVVVFQADVDGYRAEASNTLRMAVYDYLDTVRPVTAYHAVSTVAWVDVDCEIVVTVMDDGVEIEDVEDGVETAIKDAIQAVEPGGTLYRTKLMRAISAVDGVIDFEIVSPAANVPSSIAGSYVEVLRPGTILVTE